MRNKTIPVILVLVLFAGWKFWPSSECQVNKGEQATLVNRIWIDAMPTTERDKVDVFLLIDEAEVGVFSKNSAYEGEWSMFEYDLDQGLVVHMLQEDQSYSIETKVMSGSKCAPFDHCLKMKGNPRGTTRYGSMEDWIITDTSDLRSFEKSVLFTDL